MGDILGCVIDSVIWRDGEVYRIPDLMENEEPIAHGASKEDRFLIRWSLWPR